MKNLRWKYPSNKWVCICSVCKLPSIHNVYLSPLYTGQKFLGGPLYLWPNVSWPLCWSQGHFSLKILLNLSSSSLSMPKFILSLFHFSIHPLTQHEPYEALLGLSLTWPLFHFYLVKETTYGSDAPSLANSPTSLTSSQSITPISQLLETFPWRQQMFCCIFSNSSCLFPSQGPLTTWNSFP